MCFICIYNVLRVLFYFLFFMHNVLFVFVFIFAAVCLHMLGIINFNVFCVFACVLFVFIMSCVYYFIFYFLCTMFCFFLFLFFLLYACTCWALLTLMFFVFLHVFYLYL